MGAGKGPAGLELLLLLPPRPSSSASSVRVMPRRRRRRSRRSPASVGGRVAMVVVRRVERRRRAVVARRRSRRRRSRCGSGDSGPRERRLGLAPPPFHSVRRLPLGCRGRGGVDEGHEAEAAGAARGAAAHDGGVGEGPCFSKVFFFFFLKELCESCFSSLLFSSSCSSFRFSLSFCCGGKNNSP